MLTVGSTPTAPSGPLPSALAGTHVRHIMRPGVVAVAGDASLTQVASAMAAHGVHAVLVLHTHGTSPLGWVTSAGLIAHLLEDTPFVPACDAVTEPPTYIEPSATAVDVVRALAAPGVTHLLVTPAPTAVPQGVVSDIDLIRFVARKG
jgi:CBS domain-containing protein